MDQLGIGLDVLTSRLELMLYDLLLGGFSLAMVGGGIMMVRAPELFITSANPTLELLQEHLPEGVTRRIVQGLGGMLVLFFFGYFYSRFIL